ncbi:MAG: amino acid ABC transporter substrate-binding protein [Clostridia bacterium]|nr:amino acid ABC transporter substrate-binding protein [Clostridia bacterium]
MSKKILSMALALGMALSFAGCGTTQKASTDVSAATSASASEEARTQLTVGFDAEYPPYGFKDEKTGEYTGFDLELAQEVCDRRGWKLVKQPIDWDSKDMELNSGTIDCIWNGMTYTGREKEYTWSDPYVDNSIMIVVSADSDIKTLEDLAGKVVTTQADSSALTALTEGDAVELANTFATLEQVGNYNNAFMNLKSGAVDAIAVDIGVAQFQLKNNPEGFRMLEEPLSSEQYAIAFKLGNEALRDQVQETLYEMLKDGTFGKIADKYADYNLPDMICLQAK